MAKKPAKSAPKKQAVKDSISLVRIADITAIVSSVWLMNSVAMLVYDKVNSNLDNMLACYSLIVSVLAICYSVLRKKRLSFTTAFCIGIVAASLFIWCLGLSKGSSDINWRIF